jgi:hypothetical protein
VTEAINGTGSMIGAVTGIVTGAMTASGIVAAAVTKETRCRATPQGASRYPSSPDPGQRPAGRSPSIRAITLSDDLDHPLSSHRPSASPGHAELSPGPGPLHSPHPTTPHHPTPSLPPPGLPPAHLQVRDQLGELGPHREQEEREQAVAAGGQPGRSWRRVAGGGGEGRGDRGRSRKKRRQVSGEGKVERAGSRCLLP